MTKCLKTMLALLLTAVLLISALPFTASASSAMTVTVETKNAIAGSTVNLDVKISNNPGFAAISLDIDYDKTNLLLKGFTYNDTALAGASTTPYNASASTPCLYVVNGSQNISGDFTLATLTFEVKANANNNTSAYVKLTYDPENIYNINEQNISCNTTNGAVDIVTCIPGDINGDEKVNSKDVSRLMQYHAHWDVVVNEPALDTNGDGKLNSKDVTRLMQYLAHWDVVLYPVVDGQGLKPVSAKSATCEEDGNTAYWYDSENNKYYKDAAGLQEIALEDTVIKALGHTPITIAGYAPTTTSEGLSDGVKCSVCGKWLHEQTIIPKLSANEYSINYNIYGNDSYLQSIEINNTANPITYTSEIGVAEFAPLTVAGYTFEGWYDAPGTNGVEVKSIAKGTKGNKTLYARWSQEIYDVTYKLYQTPLKPISDEKFLHYTTGKGLPDLPNPTINNYIFLGWYTNDGKEVKSIPSGTVGNITLNAYWTSKRNLAKAKGKLDDPVILEDTDNGVIYFAYELGTIENIPLSENIWTIQSVSGLAQQKSETYTTSLSQSKADTISNTISNSTVDSGTWTLSEGWNESTSVTKEWAEQHQTTVEKANEKCLTSSNTFSITDSNGGSKATTTTDGTTTLDYNSQNYTHGNSAEFGAKVSAKYTNSTEVSASGKVGYGPVSAEAGVKNTSTFEIGGELSANYEQHQETNEHTGTDTTNINSTVDASTSTWNSSSSASSTKTASERSTVSQAVSDIISSRTGYGSTYTKNGQNSQTQGFSNTESESVNSSSALTWSSVETKTITNTYSTDGKSEGCYRLVIAGKAHVFGVVGYDISSRSYFTYTYSIMDDNQYEFLDYAPDLNFNDCENSVLPFEIPFYVYEYSTAATVKTEGLVFRTDSSAKTATVTGYTGSSTDVSIPNYITSGGTAYKVTGISAGAFAGKTIRSIALSKFIKEIPARAFKNCTSLEQISGYYNVIGDEAFSGCESLENYNITVSTKSIGTNAFYGVPQIVVNVISSEYALEYSDGDVEAAKALTQRLIDSAVSSGANRVVLGLSDIIDGCELNIEVGNIAYFELQGGKDKKFKNLNVKSNASTTVLKKITVTESNCIPLEVSSEQLTFDTVHINSNGYCLMLSKAANISLIRDNTLTSANNKAIVCKTPSFVSEATDGVAGFLKISGNIYVFGKVNGIDNIEVKTGEIIYITEDEFNNYIKGSYEVTFNANGGTVSQSSKTVYYGSAFGDLPTPTRSGFSFLGWYLNDTKVTSDTILSLAQDVTLRARWQSDWALASTMPSGADTTNIKWSYTLREYSESSSSSKSGWTLLPGNDGKKVTDYKAEQGPVYSNPSGNDRKVRSESYKIRDNYKTVWHYSRSVSARSGWNNWSVTVSNSVNYLASGPQYITIDYQLNRRSQNDIGSAAAYGNYYIDGWDCPVWYNESSEQVYVNSDYGTRWYYRDPIYTYYFYRDLDKEATSDPTGQSNVSNVQKWVKYIEK